MKKLKVIAEKVIVGPNCKVQLHENDIWDMDLSPNVQGSKVKYWLTKESVSLLMDGTEIDSYFRSIE